MMLFDPAKALAAGRTSDRWPRRSATPPWRLPLVASEPMGAGLTIERERSLMDAWASRTV